MERREAIALAVSAPLIVLASSYLGLGGRFFYVAPVDAYHLMVGIWSMSVAADAVFTLGTLAAAFATYEIARRRSSWLAVGVGLGAHWLVYWTSYVLLPMSGDIENVDPWSALVFVAMAGFVGLAVAAIAPVALARALARTGSVAAPLAPSEAAAELPER